MILMSAPFPPPGVKVFTISELTREVKTLVEEAFPRVWVSGEVSNYRRQASGHLYFDLSDAQAKLPAVMWRGNALRLRFDLRNGLEVMARGRLEVYAPHGKYQLVIEELHPKGIGALDLAFRQLKEKLSVKGYFEPGRKKPIPAFPRRIVLVTSPSGAAVRDMLEILGQRWPAVDIWICPVPVQGDGAAEQIAEAIRQLNRCADIEVLVVARGGGSLEDLWAFNEECLAHAIYESRIPIICGVGHETDYTIADMVADRRAETPTAAAMCVVPDWREEDKKLRHIQQRLHDRIERRIEGARQRLNELTQRACFRRPLDRIRDLERRLDDTTERLGRAINQRLMRANQSLEKTAGKLQSLSPLNVLSRGYSLTRKETDQSVVRRADQVRPGERIETLVQAGRIISRVEEAPAVAAESQG
jgi:exodeoxyribonuclease VII large subunit